MSCFEISKFCLMMITRMLLLIRALTGMVQKERFLVNTWREQICPNVLFYGHKNVL